MQQLRLFLAAVQFFTRLPVPSWVGHSAQHLEQAGRYLPLIGMLVGAIAAAVLWGSAAALPLGIAVLLSMAASILVTGAFHEDGLSDFADGMGGGHSREQILAIMKDPRAGPYGVIALGLTLAIKYQALLTLCTKHSLAIAAASLVAAHCISRLAAVTVMFEQRYVRDDASARAKPAARTANVVGYVVALGVGLGALVLLGAAGVPARALFGALAGAVALRTYLAWLLLRRLGGYTGDCLGAVQQLSEVTFYLGLLAVWH